MLSAKRAHGYVITGGGFGQYVPRSRTASLIVSLSAVIRTGLAPVTIDSSSRHRDRRCFDRPIRYAAHQNRDPETRRSQAVSAGLRSLGKRGLSRALTCAPISPASSK